MDLPFVPVIIKRINPTKPVGEDRSEVVSVVNVHAFPIQLCECDKDNDTDVLDIEPRLACVINGTPHLLALSPDREPNAIIYETYIKYSVPEVSNDERNVSRDTDAEAGPDEVQGSVPRPDNGGGEQVAGGDETPNGPPIHSGGGNSKLRS